MERRRQQGSSTASPSQTCQAPPVSRPASQPSAPPRPPLIPHLLPCACSRAALSPPPQAHCHRCRHECQTPPLPHPPTHPPTHPHSSLSLPSFVPCRRPLPARHSRPDPAGAQQRGHPGVWPHPVGCPRPLPAHYGPQRRRKDKHPQARCLPACLALSACLPAGLPACLRSHPASLHAHTATAHVRSVLVCFSCCRTVAGLWNSGSGDILRHGQPMGRAEGEVGKNATLARCWQDVQRLPALPCSLTSNTADNCPSCLPACLPPACLAGRHFLRAPAAVRRAGHAARPAALPNLGQAGRAQQQ